MPFLYEQLDTLREFGSYTEIPPYIQENVNQRFELRPYQIRLGTVDQDEAENEWILHQYTNSSKKRKLLSAE